MIYWTVKLPLSVKYGWQTIIGMNDSFPEPLIFHEIISEPITDIYESLMDQY